VPVVVGLEFKAVEVEVALEASPVAVDVRVALEAIPSADEVELEPFLDPAPFPSLTLLLLSVWLILWQGLAAETERAREMTVKIRTVFMAKVNEVYLQD